ncbi:MAG: tyrosine-type recombinase/integrase [Bacteroidia bacterium]
MTKVNLRTKTMSGSRKNLYLDFYPPIIHPDTGNPTRREFLGLHLFEKPKTDIEKKHNADTKALAENIRATRQIEIQNGQYGFLSTNDLNANFVEYFKELADEHNQRNREIWLCALHYLKEFTGGTIRFTDITPKFCNEFKEYLLKAQRIRSKLPISQNTAFSYFNKLKAALKQAFKDGILKTDISSKVERIKEAETERQFLTMEELNTLAKTECSLPILKQAALFASLSGLRFSDIQKLVWAEVQHSKAEGYFLRFRQKKTKGVEVLPISEQAYNLLGEPGLPDEPVFVGLQYSAFMNFHLKRWVLKAGITKDITFHCFRHTYATLQLSAGTDIFTVSKMLGHRELKTTMIYAKIIDQTKREAATKIKLEM